MDEKVEAWFQLLSEPQRIQLTRLRRLILAADDQIVEQIKWNQPCYSRSKLFCYLQKSARHVTIGFQNGSHLSDTDRLLVGDGKDMRHVRIALEEDFDAPAINRLIEEALAIDERQR